MASLVLPSQKRETGLAQASGGALEHVVRLAMSSPTEQWLAISACIRTSRHWTAGKDAYWPTKVAVTLEGPTRRAYSEAGC
jgi:hypothetical protein